MQITLNITEDSKVELVKDNYELVQGECCFTDFVFNFPQTIKGYAIGEYSKTIEFAECKDLGECVKFVDEIKGNTYELEETCTAFKKIMVQIVLERIADGKKITWKTIPFTLEFAESINANGDKAIQAQLLSLAEIRNEWQKDFEDTKDEWEAFVKASCLRMVYSSANIPLANAESEGDTIFYLGDNSGDFTYGHYYRCVNIDDTCVWQDLTQDPSLEGVANGIREINKNRAIQLFVGGFEEIKNANTEGDTIFIPEDVDAVEEIKEILSEAVAFNDIYLDDNKRILVFDKNEHAEDKGITRNDGEFTHPYKQKIDISRYADGVCNLFNSVSLGDTIEAKVNGIVFRGTIATEPMQNEDCVGFGNFGDKPTEGSYYVFFAPVFSGIKGTFEDGDDPNILGGFLKRAIKTIVPYMWLKQVGYNLHLYFGGVLVQENLDKGFSSAETTITINRKDGVLTSLYKVIE